MTKKTHTLITMALCCYNSQNTVERAINSALAQDWPNFELIIVDDGSSDNTPAIIQKIIKGHDNAYFIQHEKNKSFPGALNTVLSQAKGEFIAIFDDDDASRPDRLSIQYKTIVAHENKTGKKLIACWGSRIGRYPNGYDVHHRAIGSESQHPIGTEIINYLLCYDNKLGVFFGSGTPSCALMTRKATYDEVGHYDETMFRSEDSDFSIRLGLKGGHFIGCPEEIVIQYSTGGEEKKADVMYNSYRMLMEKYQDYLKSQKLFGYAMAWNKLRLHYFSGQLFKAFIVLIYLFLRYPFRTWKHFWSTAPRRLIHEWKMSRRIN